MNTKVFAGAQFFIGFCSQLLHHRWISIVGVLTYSNWTQSKSTSSPYTRPRRRHLPLGWETRRATCGVTIEWASNGSTGLTTNQSSIRSPRILALSRAKHPVITSSAKADASHSVFRIQTSCRTRWHNNQRSDGLTHSTFPFLFGFL
jgi:hypothetical protein